MLTASGTIGSVNSTDDASATDDPNNMIQLSTTEKGQDLDIAFAANGASQSFSIDYALNTRTNGYSTGYLTTDQATGVDAMVKVVYSAEQGQQNDGITVTFAADANDRSVVWDKENDTLTVTNAATATADAVALQITNAVSSTFTATVVGGGGAAASAFENGDSTTLEDGRLYDSMTVNLATDANGTVTTTAAEAVNAINASSAFTGLDISATHVFSSDGSGAMETGTLSLDRFGITETAATASGMTSAVDGADAQLVITAKTAGSGYDNVRVAIVKDAALTANSDEYATYDATNKVLTFTVDTASTAANIVNNWASNSLSAAAAALFTVAIDGDGDGSGVVDVDDTGYLSGGSTYSGTSTGGLGAEGNFDANDIVGTGGLEFRSTSYGETQFVSVKAISGTFTTVDADSAIKDRDYGIDANVRINGITAVTDGLDVSLNTSTLDFRFRLDASVTAGSTLSFQIVSGGAQFQLGPDVVSNQQARVGIQSANTAKLGGVSGRLFQLKSGGVYSLGNNVSRAAKVVGEAITAVTTLRGRLGAFQRTTLDSNIASLSDTLENLTDAESSIRDADFAAESASLTRAQILVQSGISVLSMANSNPQNVLALLR